MKLFSNHSTTYHRHFEKIVANGRFWIYLTIVTAAFLFLYRKVLIDLVHHWGSNDVYSHGYLIPLISLYLIWIYRKRLFKMAPSPNVVFGSMLLLFSLSMLLVGHAGGIFVLEALSLPFTIAGIVLLVLGNAFLRILWFPIAYLFFMVPIWEIITNPLQSIFQKLTAKLAVILIQIAGIQAYRDGVFLALPHVNLEVARVCSGVNYLIAVIALCIPLTYLYIRTWSRKIILVCTAIIITLLTNGLRVALIGILTYYDIGNTLHGPGHVLQALSVTAVGYVTLFFGVWVLSSKQPKARLGWKSSLQSHTGQLSKKKQFYLATLLLIMLTLLGGYINFVKPLPIPLRKDLRFLPAQVGKWTGSDIYSGFYAYRDMEIDHELTRIYRDTSRNELTLYIGYFEYQDQGKELIHYNLQKLYGNGVEVDIPLNSQEKIRVNQAIYKDDHKRKFLILYWYDLNGRIIANRYKAKVITAIDGLFYRRTNGAIVMALRKLNSSDETRQLSSHHVDFVRSIFPLLNNYLPRYEM